MILGLGIDIVELARIERSMECFGQRFIKKVLTEKEITSLEQKGQLKAHSVAARFAAKEATVKALGTGFSDGIGLHDIMLLPLESGQPQLFLTGKALIKYNEMKITHSHVSISHGKDNACAVVVFERQ